MTATTPCLPCGSTPVVTNVPGPQGVQGAPGAAGATGPTGATGPSLTSMNAAAYAAGTAYTLTATAAQMAFGTTTPALSGLTPGTYLIFGRVNFKSVGATLVNTDTITSYLYDTSVPGIIPNSSTVLNCPAQTTLTNTLAAIQTPPILYVVTSVSVIQLWGVMNVIPSAGSVTAVEASIVAVRVA